MVGTRIEWEKLIVELNLWGVITINRSLTQKLASSLSALAANEKRFTEFPE